MSLVLKLGEGVYLGDGVPDGWLPPGLDEELRAALAEWHALARADDAEVRAALATRADELAVAIAARTGTAVHVVDGDDDRVVHPPEPTPWGTGLVLAGGTAAFVLIGFLALYDGLAALSPLVATGVGLVLVVCLLPTLLRYRAEPVWRWFVAGAGAGIVVAWSWLLLTALV